MPPSAWIKALQFGSTVGANIPKHKVEKPNSPKSPNSQPCKLEGVFHSWLCKVANKNAKDRNHPKHHRSPRHTHVTPCAPSAWRSWCPMTSESSKSSFSLKLLLAFYPATCWSELSRKAWEENSVSSPARESSNSHHPFQMVAQAQGCR